MARKISDEERIVEYFTHAPADRIDALFNVVRGIVRGRVPRIAKVRKAKARTTESLQE